MEEYERSGRSREATTKKTFVDSLIMFDRKRRLRHIARQIGISAGVVQYVLTDIQSLI